MTDKPRVVVILLRESVWQSWGRDLGTFATIVALVGIGIWAGSSAMQWVGAIMGFVTTICWSGRHKVEMTIADARKKLDEIESAGGQA